MADIQTSSALFTTLSTIPNVNPDPASFPMDLTLSEWSASGTILEVRTTQSTSSSSRVALIDDGTAHVMRVGNLAICTMRISVDDDDEVNITPPESVLPTGGKLVSVTVSGYHRWDNNEMTVRASENERAIRINRSSDIDSTVNIEIHFITTGWPDLRNQTVLSDSPISIAYNTVYPTGRIVDGKVEYQCTYKYDMKNHTTATAIFVPPPTNFISMGEILSIEGGADNGSLFQGIEDASNDINADDLTIVRSSGAFNHTYEGNWSGYTMRLVIRFLAA